MKLKVRDVEAVKSECEKENQKLVNEINSLKEDATNSGNEIITKYENSFKEFEEQIKLLNDEKNKLQVLADEFDQFKTNDYESLNQKLTHMDQIRIKYEVSCNSLSL